MVSSMTLHTPARGKPRRGRAVFALVGILAALLFAPRAAEAMTYGRVTYSDISVDSNGTIYGWGITDANSAGCYCHTAKVTTTITSPQGRTQTASDIYGGRGHEYARADVSLGFLSTDVGNYTLSSTHWAFCPYCGCYFISGTHTGASETVCDFDLNGAAYPVCDGLTLAHTVYQANIRGGCTAVPYPYGSDLTFTGTGSVYPDHSTQSYGSGAPPTLHAYYDAGPDPGAVRPKFKIKFAEPGNTITKEKTDPVCQ